MIQPVHQAVAAEPQPPTKGMKMMKTMKGMKVMKTTISICKWAVKTCYRWEMCKTVSTTRFSISSYPQVNIDMVRMWDVVEFQITVR